MQYWTVPLVAALANAFLLQFVVRKGPPGQTREAFAFLALTFVFWNLNFFSLYFFEDYEVLSNATRVCRLGAVFMPAAVFHLILSLRELRNLNWRFALAANYAVAIGLGVANATDYFVVALRPFEWGHYSVPGPAYDVFSAYLIANLLVSMSILVNDYRTASTPRMRLQLRFWLLGAAIAMPLGCTNLLPAYGVPIYPLGNLGNAAWAGLVAYAVVRHRLMGIDLIVTKGMAFTSGILVIVVPFFALSVWAQRAALGSINIDVALATLGALIAVALLFPTFLSGVESRLQSSLFPEKYEYRSSLISFTRSITSILDQDHLTRELATTLWRTLRLESVAVVLHDPRRDELCTAYAVPARTPRFQCSARSDFALAIAEGSRALLSTEIADRPDDRVHRAIASNFSQSEWEVCIPLKMGTDFLGFIALGRKADFDAFTAQDLELLEALAGEASVAIANAKLYREVRQSRDIIERADRSSALGVLAAGIAHEIRNPLVSIQTFFQLAPDRLHDEEFATAFLDTASGEVQRIAKLINELLAFAKSPTPSMEPTNLEDVVSSALVLLSPEAKKQKVQLIKEATPDTPTVVGNFEQIRQILVNLIFNSIHASCEGGAIRVITRPSETNGEPCGQIEVTDEGCGIPAEQIQGIFDPFYTTKPSGTGLGLAIVHRIVREHQGSIDVQSTVGIGTSFFVDFPAQSQRREQLT